MKEINRDIIIVTVLSFIAGVLLTLILTNH